MRKPPHTIVHHGQLWARLYVPVDVRQVLGEKLFLKKVGPWPMPLPIATALSATLVAGWKKQIERARHEPTGIQAVISAKEETARDVIDLLVDLVADEGLPSQRAAAEELRQIAHGLLEQARKPLSALSDEPPPQSGSAIPFLHFFDDWKKKTHLHGKTLDQAASDIKQFAATVERTLGDISGADVQQWIEGSLETASAVTVRRKLSGLRSYWGWLQSHERVSRDRNPFSGRMVKDRRTKVEQALQKRQRFEPDEIKKLVVSAADDAPLQALIQLAAFTGARREGLASMRTESVQKVQQVECFRLAEKTEAGVRLVPVHPEISDLVQQLIHDSKDGFLIPSEADKYGHRGDHLGKQFTKLKTSLGFGANHTFHSIRHTVVSLFRHAGCPVEIRNQILGHEDGDGDVGAGGHYGGEITPALKLEWIKRAIRY